jgi:hypothetical protein
LNRIKRGRLSIIVQTLLGRTGTGSEKETTFTYKFFMKELIGAKPRTPPSRASTSGVGRVFCAALLVAQSVLQSIIAMADVK